MAKERINKLERRLATNKTDLLHEKGIFYTQDAEDSQILSEKGRLFPIEGLRRVMGARFFLILYFWNRPSISVSNPRFRHSLLLIRQRINELPSRSIQ